MSNSVIGSPPNQGDYPIYYEYTKNPAFFMLAFSYATRSFTCYFISRQTQTWSTPMNWMMINGTVTASYFSPDYTRGEYISSEGLQGWGFYWTGLMWRAGLWTTNTEPKNLYYPSTFLTVTPLTRVFPYNTTQGGYLSYKSSLQIISTDISITNIPALPDPNGDVVQNSLGRMGGQLGQPLPLSLNVSLHFNSTSNSSGSSGSSGPGSSGPGSGPPNFNAVEVHPVNDTSNCYRCVYRAPINNTYTWSWNMITNECVPDFNRTNPHLKYHTVTSLSILKIYRTA